MYQWNEVNLHHYSRTVIHKMTKRETFRREPFKMCVFANWDTHKRINLAKTFSLFKGLASIQLLLTINQHKYYLVCLRSSCFNTSKLRRRVHGVSMLVRINRSHEWSWYHNRPFMNKHWTVQVDQYDVTNIGYSVSVAHCWYFWVSPCDKIAPSIATIFSKMQWCWFAWKCWITQCSRKLLYKIVF